MCTATRLEKLSKSNFENEEFTQYGILKLAAERNAKYHQYKKGKMVYGFHDGSSICFDDAKSAYHIQGH